MKRGKEGKKERGKAEFSLCENSNDLWILANGSIGKPSLPLSLKTILDSKICFKLICGAGNENLDEVEKLVALYSAAGCRFFDLAASEEVLKAAQRGLDFSIPKENQNDYHFCVSIGTKNDAHFKKARGKEGKRESCLKCGRCIKICPQRAIKRERGKEGKKESIEIIEKYCIGCGNCIKICPEGLIELWERPRKAFPLSLLPSFPLACVELHVSDAESALEQWDELKNFEGMLSICIGRKVFSDGEISELLTKMVSQRPPYSVIIQADGNPMTGGEDDVETTLPAVETGLFIKSLKLPVYLILSGGTNSKTAQLCQEKGLEVDGIAFGSYARKIVKKYIEREDFFENRTFFDEACSVVKKLLNSLN